ncbi:MAG: hypothetical protein EOR87_28935 [Mesorhizobium sp.]|nr:MAG: hypothetical protein EOR87_28935 [Mesorhizobium sp.]
MASTPNSVFGFNRRKGGRYVMPDSSSELTAISIERSYRLAMADHPSAIAAFAFRKECFVNKVILTAIWQGAFLSLPGAVRPTAATG